MKKIAIISESYNQYMVFMRINYKDEKLIDGLSKKYIYVNVNNYESLSGIELSSFIFASDRLRDMYYLFKKIESRVR